MTHEDLPALDDNGVGIVECGQPAINELLELVGLRNTAGSLDLVDGAAAAVDARGRVVNGDLDLIKRSEYRGRTATIAAAKTLCEEFDASLTAATLKAVEVTEEACSVVWSQEGVIKWCGPNDNFRPYIRVNEKLSSESRVDYRITLDGPLEARYINWLPKEEADALSKHFDGPSKGTHQPIATAGNVSEELEAERLVKHEKKRQRGKKSGGKRQI